MVIGACVLTAEQVRTLAQAGILDGKDVSVARRAFFSDLILATATVARTLVVDAWEIDERREVEKVTMNEIEHRGITQLLKSVRHGLTRTPGLAIDQLVAPALADAVARSGGLQRSPSTGVAVSAADARAAKLARHNEAAGLVDHAFPGRRPAARQVQAVNGGSETDSDENPL